MYTFMYFNGHMKLFKLFCNTHKKAFTLFKHLDPEKCTFRDLS